MSIEIETPTPRLPTARSLPEGWRWVRLGDVVEEAQGGFASGKREPEGIAQLRMNNVTNRGSFDWSSVIRVPIDTRAVAKYQLHPGDVLFNNTNSTELVGKSALFTGYEEPIVYSNHFTRLRTNESVLDSALLALWLQSQWQQRVFAEMCNKWIGQSAVQRDKLLSLQIPLPPLPEQKRIAAILGEQMAAVERARVAARAQLEAAKALPAAYLREVFDSPEARAWPMRRLGEVCDAVRGVTFSSGEASSQAFDGSIACLATGAVQETVDWDSHRFIPEQKVTSSRQYLKVGDLLVSTANSKALVDRLPYPATFGAFVTVLRPNAAVDPRLLALWMQSGDALQYCFHMSSNTTNISNLRVSDLMAFEMPIPPLDTQQQIVSAMVDQMSRSGQVGGGVQDQLAAIEKLPAALLRRAFAGEV